MQEAQIGFETLLNIAASVSQIVIAISSVVIAITLLANKRG
jgi:hypothetical protein